MDYHHGTVIITAFFLKTFSLVAGDAQTHYLLNSNGTCVNSPLKIDLWGTGTSSVKLKLSQNQTALNTNGTNGTVCKMLWDEQLGTRTLLKLTFIQNDTCDDRLEIAAHNKSSKEYNLCPPNGTDGVTFVDFNGSMTMTYYAGLVNTSNRWRFEALLTQYIFLPKDFPCPVPFIKCDTNRCISNYLQLDGDPNCEDGTDEIEPTTTSSSTTPSTVTSTTVSPATSTTASLTSSVTSSATSSVTSAALASTAPSASLSTTASSAMSTTELSASSSTTSPPPSTAASPAITTAGWITPSTNNTATSIARFMAGLSGTQFMSAMLVPVALIICTVSSVVCLRRRKRSHYYENTLDSQTL